MSPRVEGSTADVDDQGKVILRRVVLNQNTTLVELMFKGSSGTVETSVAVRS